MSASDLLKHNAEGGTIAYRLFGSFTSNLAGARITRSRFAETLDLVELNDIADWVREADYVKALNETASRRGKPIANQVARNTSDPTGRRVVIDVLPVPAANDAVAFEVKRGTWSETEECGTDLKIGARVVANGSGIWALPPRDEDGGTAAEDAACMSVAKQIADEAFDSCGYVTSTLVSKTMSRVYQSCGTFSRFLCEGAKLGIEGRKGTEILLKLAELVRQRHFDGFNGIRLNVVDIPRSANNDQQWGDALLDTIAGNAQEMVTRLAKEAKSGKVRASTLATRQSEAQSMLDQIRDNEAVLGEWADLLKRRAEAIRKAYADAVSGMDLGLPDDIDEADPAKVAPATEAPAPEADPDPDPQSAPASAPAPESDSEELSAFDL